MDHSLRLAQIIGPYCIVVGIGILANRKFYEKMMADFAKNSALLCWGGVMALVIGLLIALSHNVWSGFWPIIITLIGWIGIVKGAWILVFPTTVPKTLQLYQTKTHLFTAHLIFVCLLGLGLTIYGYFGG